MADVDALTTAVWLAAVGQECDAQGAAFVGPVERWNGVLSSPAVAGIERVGGGHPAVDGELAAGGVAALVAGQVHIQRRNVLGSAHPLERNAGRSVLHGRVAAVHL